MNPCGCGATGEPETCGQVGAVACLSRFPQPNLPERLQSVATRPMPAMAALQSNQHSPENVDLDFPAPPAPSPDLPHSPENVATAGRRGAIAATCACTRGTRGVTSAGSSRSAWYPPARRFAAVPASRRITCRTPDGAPPFSD